MKVMVGIKNGMTRVFDGDKAVAVTIVETKNAIVSDVSEKGVELGVGKKLSKPNKALSGKYKDIGYVPQYRVWFPGAYEVKIGDVWKLKLGEKLIGEEIIL